MSINEGMMSSYRQDYETPPKFMQALAIAFDLDACCAIVKNSEGEILFSTNKADKYFTPEQDAFLQEWHGKVFMNPPYGRELTDWLYYAYIQSLAPYNEFVYCLVPARTDTKWFHDIAVKGNILLLKKRVSFLQGGYAVGSAPFPSMLVIFDKKIQYPTITTWEWDAEGEYKW